MGWVNARRQEGWSIRRISAELGVDRGTIQRRLNPNTHHKHLERAQRYRQANPLTDVQKARAVEATRKWREKNPEQKRASHQRWLEKNPGVVAERSRAAKLANLNTRFRSAKNLARKRAEAKGLLWEVVDIEALALRDEFTCRICLGPVDRNIFEKDNPWGISIDHVVPESQGGGWTWENLQITHYGCNVLRGTSSIDRVREFAREFMKRLAAQD